MISLGAQYYRPPFPGDRYWEDDLARMAASGLNTVQLWVLWGWVEPEPGRFVFDDYDRLVELAGRKGLKRGAEHDLGDPAGLDSPRGARQRDGDQPGATRWSRPTAASATSA